MNTTVYHKIKKMSPLFIVADLDRSVEFYTKKLGFDVDFRYEDFYLGIIKDGFSIHLKLCKPLKEEKQSKRDSQEQDIDITFSVDNIENLYQELLNQSVEFVQPLREMPYGKEFYVADPDGHIISFLE
jgi:catechol 2,3-dioxygenase-like lactoylglutathione lyase family enzyme